MAITWTTLTTAETANLTADKPLLGAQVIPVSPDVKIWTEIGETTSTDRTDSDYPARRAYDGKWQYDTRSNGATQTVGSDEVVYYVMDLGVTGVSIDFVAFGNHNFNTLGLTHVAVEFGTSSSFSTAYEVCDWGTIADDKRKIELDLHHTGSFPLRYSGVRFVRLKLVRPTSSFTPQLGELILGSRAQWPFNPIRPWDPTSYSGVDELTIAKSGSASRQTYAKGRFDLEAEATAKDSAFIDSLIAWFENDYGQRPFVWVENPNSAPDDWHLMVKRDVEFAFPYSGPVKREHTLRAFEQGPERYYLARGLE